MNLYIMWSKWANDLLCPADVVMGCGLFTGCTVKKASFGEKKIMHTDFHRKEFPNTGRKLKNICASAWNLCERVTIGFTSDWTKKRRGFF